jgi:hypothetical protein
MLRRNEYAAVHATLFTACGRPTSEQMITIWWQLLRDIPLEALTQSINRWLAECDNSFPTIAAIRKLASEHQHGTLLASDEAFWLVIQALRQHSPHYAPHDFCRALPPLVRRAVESCGGPAWIADLGIDNRTTYAAQFRRAYEAIAERADRTRRLPESLRPRIAGQVPARAVALLAGPLSPSAAVSTSATGDD